MAAIPKSYKKNVVEGNGILIFAILFSIIIRFVYYLNFNSIETDTTSGYIWDILSPFFNNRATSIICSGIFTIGLALICANINTTHVLIRRKTILPPAMAILLFSCHPIFINMSAEYISTLLCLLIISMLFISYNDSYKQRAAFGTSFILTLGSFFTSSLLIYFPFLWVALAMMRCMNFKAFLASLLGIFILYIPAFSFYIFTDNLDTFLRPFTSLSLQQLVHIPSMNLDITHWIIFGLSIILLAVIFTDNYINRHKDKIKTRAYLRLLSTLVVFSILAYLFLNIQPMLNIFIALSTGSLLLSHFFALAERKITVIFFYISIMVYITICLSPFLFL
ncbi:hypothetical protein JGH11_00915 [Dysgonomonas sp. Marseille-P4677]|uniref:hypothetical protein n=1 Tax=Dysgonomonas sp. Marseille-P4677 TaxID=2364790 RepID=UPI001912AC0A|nr:hypothetical protein [Dysgonomonas sp. Marseille-P4677]MBK5719421.1 hypothetical protein [Dysgonomonas sp. Marseille-P4677]